jgi:Ca2+-binding RTX toxin-like protein
LSGLAANDTLDGGAGNDTLDGGTGSDRLIGGTGNDTYIVDTTTDTIIEAADAGIDSVEFSAFSWTLGANLENLTLTGAAVIGTGNSLDNAITGNSNDNEIRGLDGNDTLNGGDGSDLLDGGNGDDILFGGNGNDLLSGGAGNDILTGGFNDRFLFNTNAAFNSADIGVDRINGFTANVDDIILDKTTFTALNSVAGNGFSAASDFALVANNNLVAGSSAFIVYSLATGDLFYNQNGSEAGLGTGAQFATIVGTPVISSADFTIWS